MVPKLNSTSPPAPLPVASETLTSPTAPDTKVLAPPIVCRWVTGPPDQPADELEGAAADVAACERVGDGAGIVADQSTGGLPEEPADALPTVTLTSALD